MSKTKNWILTGYLVLAVFNLFLNGHTLKELIFSATLGGLALLDWIDSYPKPPKGQKAS